MRIVCLVVLLTLSGCNQEELLNKFASKEDQATAKAYIDRLRSRDFDAIEKDTNPSIKSPDLRTKLETMSALLPEGQPTSVTLVGAHRFSNPDVTTSNITFEYGFEEKWFLVNVAVQDRAGAKTIVGLNVVPQGQSLESQNRFTLSGKSALQYSVLAGATAAALLTLYALVLCIKTKQLKRKWLWILFILAGIGKVGVNWTNGQVLFAPISFQLFSASAFAQLYGPWIISASLPVGAAAFLIFRRTGLAKPIGR